MISTILTLLTFGSGALGILGTLSKLLGKFAPGIASGILSNPITAAIGTVAAEFVDLVVGRRGARRHTSALDHIFSNGFAGALFIASLVVAYEVGGFQNAASGSLCPVYASSEAQASHLTADIDRSVD